MRSKTKSLVIVALVIIIAAMGVGGYFLFVAPSVPTDEIPSGSISGNTPSGDIGSGSVDVPDVLEEIQPFKVEINNFELGRLGSGGYMLFLSHDSYSKCADRIANEGYADIEIALINFELGDSKLSWTLTSNNEAVDVSEYFMLKTVDDGLSVTLRVFRLLAEDDSFIDITISDGKKSSSISLGLYEQYADLFLVA